MKTKRILLDVDGVLTGLGEVMLSIANRLANTTYTMEDRREYDIFTLPGLFKIKSDTWRVLKAPGFNNHLQPYQEAMPALDVLREIGEVRVVTTPVHCKTWVYDRTEWLMDTLGFKKREVLYVSNEEKAYIVGDAFVEDKVDNLLPWLNHGGEFGVGFIWARPYNDIRLTHPRAIRTHSWHQVIELIKERFAA